MESLASREPELRPRTAEIYRWELAYHLLPFFHVHRLSQIAIKEIDRYRQEKLREGGLCASSINKTIMRLGQILELAVQ